MIASLNQYPYSGCQAFNIPEGHNFHKYNNVIDCRSVTQADERPHLAVHEQPNGKSDIEPSFNHTGVHNCNCNLAVRTELWSLVTKMALKIDTNKAHRKLYTKMTSEL